jgi:colanic acid biosynthesis glycosyl transferase WcaI
MMDCPKKITIITANYYPEDTAIGLYTTQFANYLKKEGYAVQVITGFPYYPQWKIKDSYSNRPSFFSETVDGIDIFRFKQFIPQNVTLISRILMMLSLFFGTIINLRKIKKTDLVLCIVPFTISIIPALFLSKIKKAKLWIHVQDFEFDLALESGIINKNNYAPSLLKKSIFSLETALLSAADLVSSISYTMLEKIKEKSSHSNPYFFPNWISAEKINPKTSFQHPLIDTTKFTLLYSGNIGEKQDWQLLQKLCVLVDKYDAIEIVIVGDGSYKKTLKDNLAAFNFVKFYNPVPYEELNDLLCSADAHFLFQKTTVLDTIMPSKILAMMASGKPSVISGHAISEVNTIISESNGGYYFTGINAANEVYSALLEIKNNTVTTDMGENARTYIIEKFSEKLILSNVALKIKSLINGNT